MLPPMSSASPPTAPAASAPAPQPAPAGQAQQPPQQIPPAIAQHIDPNNKLQMLLLQRVDKFTPQDGQAIATMSPEALAAVKKIVPEIAFVFDLVIQKAGADASGRALPAAPMPAQAPSAGAQQPPMTRLGSM